MYFSKMKQIEMLVFAASMLIFGLGVLIAIADQDMFRSFVIVEDGILEWTTVLAIGVAAAVSFGRLLAGFRTFGPMKKLLLLSIVVLAIFGIGEEISWGQRLLGFKTPQWFYENNYQRELNVHNLVIGDVRFHKDVFPKVLLLFFLLYLGVFVPLHNNSAKIRRLADAWGIPVPQNYQIVGYIAVIVIVEGFLKMATDGLPRRGELTEFIVSIIVALNIVYPRNRAIYSMEPT